jgi:hypothetical protein
MPATGVILCICRARAGYVLRSGSSTRYRCPACASQYAAPEWQAEALPHIAAQFEAMVYDGYKLHRATYTPEQLAELFLTLRPRIEQLEARYQAELAGKRAAS